MICSGWYMFVALILSAIAQIVNAVFVHSIGQLYFTTFGTVNYAKRGVFLLFLAFLKTLKVQTILKKKVAATTQTLLMWFVEHLVCCLELETKLTDFSFAVP